jgi:hypothetical protein
LGAFFTKRLVTLIGTFSDEFDVGAKYFAAVRLQFKDPEEHEWLGILR